MNHRQQLMFRVALEFIGCAVIVTLLSVWCGP